MSALMLALPTSLLTPANAATAIVAMNFLSFSAFGIDKWKAETGRWRTSEATLLPILSNGLDEKFSGSHAGCAFGEVRPLEAPPTPANDPQHSPLGRLPLSVPRHTGCRSRTPWQSLPIRQGQR